VKFEILQNDLASGKGQEWVTDVLIDGESFGECAPDGGDYDCTFFTCDFEKKEFQSVSGNVDLDVRLKGHSKDCDCDTSTWECSAENSVPDRTPMTAVGRFTFTPDERSVVVYTEATLGVTGTQGAPTTSNTGSITLVPNANYIVTFEILRNDLAGGKGQEWVTGVLIDGESFGECAPDGGDQDCTFFTCELEKKRFQSVSGNVDLDVQLQGHSWDCDCDTSTWECWAQESTLSSVPGRTPMTAVGRFTFTPEELHDR